MPDLKVTFRGDLGNLQTFDNAIKQSAASSERAWSRANQNILASIGKLDTSFQKLTGSPDLFIKNQKLMADSINKTFRHSGDVVRNFVRGYDVEFDKISNTFKAIPKLAQLYDSSFDKAVGNLTAYQAALKNVASSEKELQAIRRRSAQTVARAETRRYNAQSDIDAARKFLREDPGLRESIRQRDLALDTKRFADADLAQYRPGQKGIVQARKVAQAAAQDLAAAEQALAKTVDPINAHIDTLQRTVDRVPAAIGRAERALTQAERRITSRRAYKDLDLAANATPPIQADLQRVLADSPDLRKKLTQGGLGLRQQYGTADFQRALAQQEASVTSYTRNLRTGVRTVQGEFRDLSGLASKFTVDLDDNGKVLGRWGGQLGGAGSILRQTVRDFQKVIEWTVATTLVFGSLAAVVGQLQSINELNTLLARFSITAQTSSETTGEFFDTLTQVAINTATPLKEIITVADDIALATREAGDSTDEWKSKIVDLTTAVGIFTNLTGKDTVTAADQLSAAFKQLNVAPSELVTILNKVTAVAGGQANAIADIVQSVAGLAEAAKAAGFSVDDMIASVQVLSQVTNKTSAEVATAFKNLFGSVSSVGSEKILSQFGISIRDASGGVRDFLDIYRDVRRALDEGIIPQNRLPDVLRGIAGGPRRAPDAAALLSNIGRIDQVIQRSQNASNEALVANAAILDTNQAKITQFQNAIDATVFKQFGEAVADLTGHLATLGKIFTDVFSIIPSGIASTIIQVTLLTTAIVAFGKVISLIGRGLGITAAIRGLKQLGDAFKYEATAAQIATDTKFAQRFGAGPYKQDVGFLGTPSTGGTSRSRAIRGAFGRGNFGKIGAIAGLAGIAGGTIAASQAGSGIDAGTIGAILQAGGSIATLVPGLQAVGIAALVAGTAIQLFSKNTEDAKDNSAAISKEIYDLTQNLKNTQAEADGFAAAQKAASDTLKGLQTGVKLTADEQQRLTSTTNDYVVATLGLANANREAAKSFDEILKKLGDSGKYSGDFINAIRNAGLDPDNPELKRLQQQLATDILKNTGQGIFAGAPAALADTFSRAVGTGTTGRYGLARGGRAGLIAAQGGQTLDLAELANNPELLRKLFNLDASGPGRGKLVQGAVPQNEIALGYVQSAISQAIEQFQRGEGSFTSEDINNMVAAVTELTATVSSFTQNATALAQQNALVQAKTLTGAFTAQQGQRAGTNLGIAGSLNEALAGFSDQGVGPRGEYADPRIQKSIDLMKELSAAAVAGQDVSNQKLVETATLVLQLTGVYGDLKTKGEEALSLGIIEWLRQAGVDQEILNQLAQQYNVTLQETIEANDILVNSLDKAKTAAADAYAQRALQLEVSENSGQFEDNAKGLAVLKEQNKQAYDSTIALIDAMGVLSDTAFTEVNNQLANVIGLQGEFISQAEIARVRTLEDADQTQYWADRTAELSGKLIENAVAAGVNAEGIKKIKAEVEKLIATIVAIPDYKQVIIDLKLRMQSPGVAGPSSLSTAAAQIKDLEKQQAKGQTDASAEINRIIKSINNAFTSGSGSNLGAAPKAAKTPKAAASVAYNKPGLLDIPEEILNQSNASSLIKQAVANARKLQGQVPGEAKQNRNEIVELLNGTKRVLETRGVGEEYLRRAMDELRDEIKRQNDLLAKADTIRRIRVGGGDFSAIANVPINSKSGVSVGGIGGPISVALDVNGTVFTPAQLSQFADMVAASLKRQLAS